MRIGFSTAGSPLVLGVCDEHVCFDSEGHFCSGKKKAVASQRLSRDQVISVLLNLDPKSPNANTLSLFRDGERISEPQASQPLACPPIAFAALNRHQYLPSSEIGAPIIIVIISIIIGILIARRRCSPRPPSTSGILAKGCRQHPHRSLSPWLPQPSTAIDIGRRHRWPPAASSSIVAVRVDSSPQAPSIFAVVKDRSGQHHRRSSSPWSSPSLALS